MIDLRKLFNELQEVCDEEVEYIPEGKDLVAATDLNPKIGDKLINLGVGIDELEKEVKNLITQTETLKEGIEEVADSLY